MSVKHAFAGTCWHLRRLDWCEDIGEPIVDEVSLQISLTLFCFLYPLIRCTLSLVFIIFSTRKESGENIICCDVNFE